MNGITNFAHAGHHHEQAATASHMTLIVFAFTVAVMAIVAAVLTVRNRRKNPVSESIDEETK